MVIGDLYLLGGAIVPDKTDPPLIVDPDAVLSFAVALERFEAVAGRRPQIQKPGCRVEHIELAQRHRPDALELGDGLAPVQCLAAPIPKGSDHREQI